MDTNQFKLFAMLAKMVTDADKFHLEVARRLLSSQPLSEGEKVALLDRVAQKEATHEQMDAAISQMIEVLRRMD